MTDTIRRTQQSQVYAAERSLASRGREFASLDEIQTFVDDLRETDWWDQLAPKVYRIEVAPGSDCDRSNLGSWHEEAGAGLIELHPHGRNMHTVLHEAAHVIANSNVAHSGHDPYWVRTLLTLTYHVRGSDAYVELRQALLAHDVVIDTGA